MGWLLASSSDPRALAVVDGTLDGSGPHYSRRTPGSKTFTGVGREIVLVTSCNRACWAVVYQQLPKPKGSGQSRGRSGAIAVTRYVWRNMLFRNLGAGLSSQLIQDALGVTYEQWLHRYGALPPERMRTEIKVSAVRSQNPGYCYLAAGWIHDRYVRGKRYLWAPERGCQTDRVA